MQVLKFDTDNYDYLRIVCPISIAAMADGSTAADQLFDLRQDYDELVGIAVYDRSADVFQFSMTSQIVNGDVIQDYTARKGWIFSGALTTDSYMPESEHYKLVCIPYKRRKLDTILFRIQNNSGAAFGSTLKLDIVLVVRKLRTPLN